jgi:hypothetical protein
MMSGGRLMQDGILRRGSWVLNLILFFPVLSSFPFVSFFFPFYSGFFGR